jgi:hypothetical protein
MFDVEIERMDGGKRFPPKIVYLMKDSVVGGRKPEEISSINMSSGTTRCLEREKKLGSRPCQSLKPVVPRQHCRLAR